MVHTEGGVVARASDGFGVSAAGDVSGSDSVGAVVAAVSDGPEGVPAAAVGAMVEVVPSALSCGAMPPVVGGGAAAVVVGLVRAGSGGGVMTRMVAVGRA